MPIQQNPFPFHKGENMKHQFTIFKSTRKNAYVIESNEIGVIDLQDIELNFSIYDDDKMNEIVEKYNTVPLTPDDEGYELFFHTKKDAELFLDEFLIPNFIVNSLC